MNSETNKTVTMDDFLMWFGILSCLSAIIFIYMKNSFWKRHKVPFIKPRLPYMSSFTRDKNLSLQYADFYRKYRSNNCPLIGTYGMIWDPLALIVDLELIRCVLKTNYSHFQDRGMFHNAKDDPLSASLGTLSHDNWKPRRQILSKAYSLTKLKCMCPKILACNVKFVKWLIENSHSQIEICDTFGRFMTDVIGAVAFGIDCNTLEEPESELRIMMKKAKQTNLQFPRNILTDSYSKLSRWCRLTKHRKDVGCFFVQFFQQIMEKRVENDKKHGDYMDCLIELKNESGRTVNDIVALAFDLFSAGSVDASSALAYCVYELALEENETIQNKARSEIMSVLERHDGEVTYSALPEFVYCEQIIKEAMRKHPLSGSLTRVATKSYTVTFAENENFTIKKGMRIKIPIYAIHHDATFYPNPEKFRPERFSPEEFQKLGTYFPFGDGPRRCFGNHFAKLLVKIGLVFLVQNFVFSTCERTDIPINYSSTKNTLLPRSGIWLNLSPI